MKLKNTLRMEREIRLMRQLTGAGMVSLYGVFEDDARKSLVMEYCSGGDLFKYLLLRGGHLDEHWVCTEVSPNSIHICLGTWPLLQGLKAAVLCLQFESSAAAMSCSLKFQPLQAIAFRIRNWFCSSKSASDFQPLESLCEQSSTNMAVHTSRKSFCCRCKRWLAMRSTIPVFCAQDRPGMPRVVHHHCMRC